MKLKRKTNFTGYIPINNKKIMSVTYQKERKKKIEKKKKLRFLSVNSTFLMYKYAIPGLGQDCLRLKAKILKKSFYLNII